MIDFPKGHKKRVVNFKNKTYFVYRDYTQLIYSLNHVYLKYLFEVQLGELV